MKIGIDISAVIYGTGVSVYTKNLVKNLLLIDKENEYVLFAGSLRRRGEIREFFHTLKGATFKGKVFPIPPTFADLMWNRLHFVPIEAFLGRLNVFHSSDWTQPPTKAFKVTTVHDLSPIKFPKATHPRTVSTHKTRLSLVRKEVSRVIVPSQATKNDLVEYGISQQKIRVIPEAPDPIFKRADIKEIDKLKKRYKIFGKYLLVVGINARKNTQRIIDAFHLAKAGEDLKLVLIGEQTFMRVEEERDIRIVGHVTREEMPVFYSGAEALVYPSIYEGFGLPILEAFACQCPVVISNISSMPEVAQDAAVLVDPHDVNSIVEGIKNALKQKKGLVNKGLKRLTQYSWQKTAKMTLKVYQEAK